MTTLTHRTCTTTVPSNTVSISGFLARAYRLWSSRRALARLTSAQLEDVGVTASEAGRPVWDVPANWRD